MNQSLRSRKKMPGINEQNVTNGNSDNPTENENSHNDCEKNENTIAEALETQQATKRVKVNNKRKTTTKNKTTKVKTNNEQVCKICLQKLNDDYLRTYVGHPNNAVDELTVLLDPQLSLFDGNEIDVDESDVRALNKITQFSIYDRNGHLCPFDAGLIEQNINLYFSGYVKPIYDENPSNEGGIPGKDFGPIVEWWISGFDGGEQAIISFSTEFGDYVLMEPSEEYAPFMHMVKEKSFLSKTIIELLLDETCNNFEYEDLLNKLRTIVIPGTLKKCNEEILLHHAQFICDRILSFDSSARDEDPLLITSPCIRTLINLAGVIFDNTGSKKNKTYNRREEEKWHQKMTQKALKDKKKFVKATTTELVSAVFENFFSDQLSNVNDNFTLKRRRCGICEFCQQPNCGECSACKNMLKFGGTGSSKQACNQRRCPNMEINEANANDMYNDDNSDLETEQDAAALPNRIILNTFKKVSSRVDCIDLIVTDKKGSFYNAMRCNGEIIKVNDYIFLESIEPSEPLHTVQVKYMWVNKMGTPMVHAVWLLRGDQTLLGKTFDSNELFMTDDCQDVPALFVKSKADVTYVNEVKVWNYSATDCSTKESQKNTSYYYNKQYDILSGRFTDVPSVKMDQKYENSKHRFCASCERCFISQSLNRFDVHNKIDNQSDHKKVHFEMFKFKNEEFTVGSGVYLLPKTFGFDYPAEKLVFNVDKQEIDENRYPEYYRKNSERYRKGTNNDTSEPYDIGYITEIFSSTSVKLLASTDLQIKVKVLFRPENTHKSESLKNRSDFNELFWSEEEITVPCAKIVGKCHLAYAENIDEPLEKWLNKGPNRFYFNQMYTRQSQEFNDPPAKACNIGKINRKDNKVKSKSKQSNDQKRNVNIPPDHPKISSKLRTLDVFAGCGGLSEGLHQSGVSENCWAIEDDECAAQAYRQNNPNCIVFDEDCNIVLKKAMNGETHINGQRLPKKGEVDLLCGGPPCQGFSGMNRFTSSNYSFFKNSLVATYLSYCDYYRPRFFIMENVKNFVTFKKNMVLQLTIKCLLKMGYQCTFGILQAGNFGVPQTRRRMILIAAAPGEILPNLPSPLHVFSKSACNLNVIIDGKKYIPNFSSNDSAPYKVVTIKDALSDLPRINNGHNVEIMNYNSDPTSHFQRKMREGVDDNSLTDHICKDLGLLAELRISHIPITPGSDWRDLPNISETLKDGTKTTKLLYNYHDVKNGLSSTGKLRGVCRCATGDGKECSPRDKQVNTIIPWCLPHSANRNNNWSGLYGRTEWDGFFATTITNPEPMGKQGRVVHPDQTRVVSVRECARSQGFRDSFKFFGNIPSKHRQIGNAVPPPLALAIGLELLKSIEKKENELKR